jgi:hypothetical protein
VPQSRHMPPRPNHRRGRLRTAQGGHDGPKLHVGQAGPN